jgi:release factor glutamine methyltransferase
MTVAKRVAGARAALVEGGVPADEAAGDAEVLARHVLGWDLASYVARRREPVPADFEARFEPLLQRRLTREPVSQIVGHREFWGLDFEVTRDVLTPRPETELVVQAALDLAGSLSSNQPIIVDVGTGSGCIAVALATELAHARFIASDASLAALTIARRNAARHHVSERIAFLHSTLVPPEEDVDLIVSNPPYVPAAARPSLPPEVRDFEPPEALFGGADGLDYYRRLLEHPGALTNGGWIIVEVGYDQGAAVRELAASGFWPDADFHRWERGRSYDDLQGIERVLTFRARRGRIIGADND